MKSNAHKYGFHIPTLPFTVRSDGTAAGGLIPMRPDVEQPPPTSSARRDAHSLALYSCCTAHGPLHPSPWTSLHALTLKPPSLWLIALLALYAASRGGAHGLHLKSEGRSLLVDGRFGEDGGTPDEHLQEEMFLHHPVHAHSDDETPSPEEHMVLTWGAQGQIITEELGLMFRQLRCVENTGVVCLVRCLGLDRVRQGQGGC